MAAPHRDDVRDFLTSRRASVSPDQVEMPTGANRRVPGLRRSEVALLAGVSIEYYTRMERGNLSGVSEQVLDAVARALRLSEAEREHLFDLARTASASPVRRQRRSSRSATVRPGLQLALDAITGGPALVRNGRLDIIADNTLARALHVAAYADPRRPVNLARHCFLDTASAEQFYPDWDQAADTIVAILRAEAGRDPYDSELQDLIGELSTRSEDFRTKWGRHDVRRHGSGEKHFNHPVVGRLDLLFESAELTTDPGWKLLIYSAEPGSPAADALTLLASWASLQGYRDPRAGLEQGAPHTGTEGQPTGGATSGRAPQN
ncbi:MAG: helix-turn-helix transcriptional regulator [Propionibacteriaceae bacterium]